MESWYMNEKKNKLQRLIGEIEKTKLALEKIETYYKDFSQNEFKKLKESTAAAIVFAEIFSDYYTCLETAFLRISKYFENSLDSEKWHTDLLGKMTLDIPSVRIPVIGHKSYMVLLEFLKFRHFRRYYFEYEYDWDRVHYLQKKFTESLPRIRKELDVFLQFIDKLIT
jgi:hypothetical protein